MNSQPAEKVVRCEACNRVLRDGDTAWASDWKVIDVSGVTVTTSFVTRYTCDGCEQATPSE